MKDILRNYLQLPFLLCIAVLGLCYGYMSYHTVRYGITLVKKSLPLKASFDDLNENMVAPYKVINKMKITDKDIIESLGTEDYLQWILEDPDVDRLSPVRYCSLFMTYYTGNPDQVPHVPEACYTGGGNQIVASSSITLVTPDPNIPDIPATFISFKGNTTEIWQTAEKFSVIYFFKVNGTYKGNRTTTRIALGDLTSEYSYFSKVEIKFFNNQGIYPTKSQAIAATEKLLNVVLPVLDKYNWPDWKNSQSE